MRFALAEALHGLDTPVPRYFVCEALRYAGAPCEERLSSKEAAIDVLKHDGSPLALRLMRELLRSEGRLTIREL